MSRAVSLCRDPGTLVKQNENQLCDYMTNEPVRLEIFQVESRLPGIPVNEPSEKHTHRFQSLYKNGSSGLLSLFQSSGFIPLVE